MPDYALEIASVIGAAPTDLVAFYETGNLPSYRNSHINCLSFEKAKEISKQIQLPSLGIWILDNANDSNPYAYISVGPCQGMILHIYHDDGSVIAFKSLGDFIEELRRAGESGIDINEIKPQTIIFPLDSEIRRLLIELPYDAEFLLNLYLEITETLEWETLQLLVGGSRLSLINSMSTYLWAQKTLDPETIDLFANSPDWQAQGALGHWLASNPKIEHLALAERLATGEELTQVTRPGKEAVRAIRKLGLSIVDLYLLDGEIANSESLQVTPDHGWRFPSWRYQNGEVQNREIQLYGDGQKLGRIEPFSVIKVRAKVDELHSCAHLVEFVGALNDTLFQESIDLLKNLEAHRYDIVYFEDTRFGRFKGNPRDHTFDGEVTWEGFFPDIPQTTAPYSPINAIQSRSYQKRSVQLLIQLYDYYKLDRNTLESRLRQALDTYIRCGEGSWGKKLKEFCLSDVHPKCRDRTVDPEEFYKGLTLRCIAIRKDIEFKFETNLFRASIPYLIKRGVFYAPYDL